VGEKLHPQVKPGGKIRKWRTMPILLFAGSAQWRIFLRIENVLYGKITVGLTHH